MLSTMLFVYFKLGNVQVGLPQGLRTLRACSYLPVRVQKSHLFSVILFCFDTETNCHFHFSLLAEPL